MMKVVFAILLVLCGSIIPSDAFTQSYYTATASKLILGGGAAGTTQLTLKAPTTLTSYSITFPTIAPTVTNNLLQSDASGNLSWVAPSSIGFLTIVTADAPLSGSGTSGSHLTFASQAANKIFASPDGSIGLPTFRSLVVNDIPNSTITYAKLQNVSANSRLLGSGSAGAGASPSEITVGTGLTMSGNTLSVSAGTGVTYGPSSTQSTLNIASGQYLYDIGYSNSVVSQNASGARITSTNTATTGALRSATGLTVGATATTGGTATGLSVAVSGGAAKYAALFSGGFVGVGTTTPETSLDVDGGLSIREDASITLTANNVAITVGDRSFLQINSNNTAGNRIITLTNGLRVGQILVIESITGNNNGFRIVDDASVGGNVNATGNLSLNNYDIATFIWDGSRWEQLLFSSNGL